MTKEEMKSEEEEEKVGASKSGFLAACPAEKEPPEDGANFFSRLTFWWLTPLLKKVLHLLVN
jgi:hypothetical protein